MTRLAANGAEATAEADLVELSLQRLAEQCPDPTARVYERLFSLHPDMEPLFVRDTTGAVRGEMLAKVFEIILDLGAQRRYAANMVRCEVVTHAGYGVPPEVFVIFFDVVAEVVREVLEDHWTAATAGAWRSLLGELAVVAR
jgi:hemoglobin-like flavoprotein